jgi:hypothetical protein
MAIQDVDDRATCGTRELNVVPAVFFGVFYLQEGGFHGKG